ncbi:hypothetical protein CBR_g46008 [Chara braunii]|uniref:Uncharacterized protein n=1 Tax=Chara braunii TaxID=69332 RepID=A0A388M030_CHABU|nr:hypothetical protein CBR_g46008 [Chara braunii]|eukprot:GBG87852.1 hypothetical protein CBR_g46008 [Chara braunii]
MVPSAIPFGYDRVKMQVRDMMGNVWSTHYVNDMFSFRHFDREAIIDEKEAVTCRPRDARIFDPPIGNPVELALAEGTVFGGEKSITYVHVRGKEATFDDICMDVWDHVAMRKDVVATSNIVAHVIQEGHLYQHVGRDMYGYHVNWVPVLGGGDTCLRLQSSCEGPGIAGGTRAALLGEDKGGRTADGVHGI